MSKELWNKEELQALIATAVDEADQQIWVEIKAGSWDERTDLMNTAEALERVANELRRIIDNA